MNDFVTGLSECQSDSGFDWGQAVFEQNPNLQGMFVQFPVGTVVEHPKGGCS